MRAFLTSDRFYMLASIACAAAMVLLPALLLWLEARP